MKLGLVSYQLAAEWDVATIIKNCSETGIEGVELRATHAHKVEIDLSADQRKEVRKQFEDSPVKLYGLGSAFDYHTPDQAKLKADIEATKQYIQLAADVGAQGVKVRPNGLPEGVPEEKTLEQIGKSFAVVAQAGADAGVQVWMEVHGRDTQDPRRMRKIVDHANHPNALLTWNCNPSEPDANGSVQWAWDLLHHKVGCVHIHELWDPRGYPYEQLVALLKESGYTGWCSYEGPGTTDSKLMLQSLRRLWDLLNRVA